MTFHSNNIKVGGVARGAFRMLKDQIKQKRVAKGWSRPQLATLAKVSLRTISEAENSGRINASKLEAIATALGCEVVLLDKTHLTDGLLA